MPRLVLIFLALLFLGGLSAVEETPPTPAPTLTDERGPVAGDLVTPDAPPVLTPAAVSDGEGASVGPPPESSPGELAVKVEGLGGREGLSGVVKVMLLITVLAVAPGFLMMVTSFTRVIIVLGFARRALGTQTLPPNQVLLGLSLFLTLFIMAPTFERLNSEAFQPYMEETISETEAWDNAQNVMRDFLARHTRKSDLALFLQIADKPRPRSIEEVDFLILVPAFITSELKTAFQMGFVIFLPFVVIDIVIAAILMSLGMMMLPPVMISLPFKILLFVLVDGWGLLLRSLVASYA